jgi:hypothetical protein
MTKHLDEIRARLEFDEQKAVEQFYVKWYSLLEISVMKENNFSLQNILDLVRWQHEQSKTDLARLIKLCETYGKALEKISEFHINHEPTVAAEMSIEALSQGRKVMGEHGN